MFELMSSLINRAGWSVVLLDGRLDEFGEKLKAGPAPAQKTVAELRHRSRPECNIVHLRDAENWMFKRRHSHRNINN